MDVLAALREHGAVTLGKHFVYKSGKHGEGYIDMDRLYPYNGLMFEVSGELVNPYATMDIDVVAAPAVGGVALVSDVCKALNFRGGLPLRVWADKEGKEFALSRAGFADVVKGKRVLVVEDLVTTGDSVIRVCREVERCGGEVIGVSVVCNRGGLTSETLGWPMHSAASVDFSAFDPDACPYCVEGRPIITDVGHGASFREVNPDYPGGWELLHG